MPFTPLTSRPDPSQTCLANRSMRVPAKPVGRMCSALCTGSQFEIPCVPERATVHHPAQLKHGANTCQSDLGAVNVRLLAVQGHVAPPSHNL